jgi:hypothetical protein
VDENVGDFRRNAFRMCNSRGFSKSRIFITFLIKNPLSGWLTQLEQNPADLCRGENVFKNRTSFVKLLDAFNAFLIVLLRPVSLAWKNSVEKQDGDGHVTRLRGCLSE